jgi:serine/threonine protein kinase/tetratricopeptide (TPR) repeat protein
MNARLLCHHGHQLEISGDLTTPELVCQRCGSVTRVKITGDTRKGSPDATLDSVAAAPAAGHGRTNVHAGSIDDSDSAIDPESAMHATQDYQPPTDTESHGQSESLSVGSRSSIVLEPPQLTGYQIIEELGRGGMGVVYRARNDLLGREVALKTLQRMDPESLRRFKQEFRTLADIAHPNLASLYELLADGTTWCFSMEILSGVQFLEYIWSGMGPPAASATTSSPENSGPRLTSERAERLTDAMTQLAVGLSTLHDAGILHSDIKPSNVLVTEEGRLVLLDFGLATPIHQIEGRLKSIQGTPLYMSPEQARGQQLTEASDWYSVGVMLYEVLTGRLPFRGKTRKVLDRKQIEDAVPPRKLQRGVPKHLNDLCVALLSRDPRQRPSAAEVLRCFGATEAAEQLLASQRVSAATQNIELVGRERHLEMLRQAFARVVAGETVSLFVHGRSGMGKTVLLRSFLDDIIGRQAAVVLEGRCYEQESVPFKALDSLIDSLAVHLGSLSDDIVHSVMPRDRLALTRVFPVLGRVAESANARYPTIENADQQELRQRAMNALRELLHRLAIREPLVLYIDDLQWGDVDSAGLLADLVRPPDAPQMLLLGSYRSEDVERSLCLHALTEAYQTGQHRPHREDLAVDSLSEREATRLALMSLGGDDETNRAYAKKIAKESHGWPFFVWELAQHVQEDPGIADQSLELDEVIWTRVNRLPAETIRLLEMIAVVGRPIPAADVYRATDAVANGPSLLAQLRTNNFIRTTETVEEGTVVEAYHDRIRESVYNHLEEGEIRDNNLSLAKMTLENCEVHPDDITSHFGRTPGFEEPTEPYDLDKQRWQQVFDLACFFDAAKEHRRSLPYALLAAEQSRKQNALEVAEQQFRIAMRGAHQVSPELRFRIYEGLGDVLCLRGKYDEANEKFVAARALVEGNLLFARLDYKLGVASFKKGDMGEARLYFEKAIKALGERPPHPLTVVPRAIKEALIQVLHTYFPSRFVGRKDPQSASGQLDLFRAGIFDQLTFSYWFSRGMNFVLWSHLRQMNIAERYPPAQELGKTYAFHAITMTGIPMAERGIAYAQKAYDISLEQGDLWGQGKARSYHTFACIVLARFKEGVAMGREAVQLLEQAGDVWESNMARMIATVPSYHLGDLKTAYLESKKAYEIGTETGDYSAVCISLLFWVPTNPKTIPPGAIQTELERPREDPLTIVGAVYARGLELLLCEDRPREAAQVLQDSLDQAKRLGLRNVCLFSAASWKATASRILAEREPAGPSQRRAVREAKKSVKAALKITKRYLACRPHALRERGLVAVLENQPEQAKRFFDESIKVAHDHQARYDHAKTLLAIGEAGLKFGWPDAQQQVAQARAILSSIEDF